MSRSQRYDQHDPGGDTEPLAIVVAVVAIVIVLSRGGLAVAPNPTASFYRRLLLTTGLIRVGALTLIVVLFIPLILTARSYGGAEPGIADGLHIGGWFALIGVAFPVAMPAAYQRYANRFLDLPVWFLRAVGVLAVIAGLGLGWLAFYVL